MRNRIFQIAITVLLSCSFLAQPAIAQSQNDSSAQQAQGKSPFMAVLLPALYQSLSTAISTSVGSGVGCLIGRFLNFIGGAKPNPDCVSPSSGSAPPAPNSSFSQGAVVSPEQATVYAKQPITALELHRYASGQINAASLGVIPPDAGSTDTFTLKSGDSFAIKFATTVPGRVRILNVDATGKTDISDLYEASPQGDNRLPREHQGNITLDDTTGMETFTLEFKPCVSQAIASRPDVARFVNLIPPCDDQAATKDFPIILPGQNVNATASGKGMTIPNSGTNQVIGVASKDAVPGELARMTIRINHTARDGDAAYTSAPAAARPPATGVGP